MWWSRDLTCSCMIAGQRVDTSRSLLQTIFDRLSFLSGAYIKCCLYRLVLWWVNDIYDMIGPGSPYRQITRPVGDPLWIWSFLYHSSHHIDVNSSDWFMSFSDTFIRMLFICHLIPIIDVIHSIKWQRTHEHIDVINAGSMVSRRYDRMRNSPWYNDDYL